MKSNRILALILSIGLVAPAVGWAQGAAPAAPPSRQGSSVREVHPEMKELMDRQREEAKALRQKHNEERQALQQKLREEGKIPSRSQKKSK
jgi:hypothetical protein